MKQSRVLKIDQVTKQFPGVLALDQVSFDLKSGEVHAICGENGAGKSTLMNIITGNQQPDFGQIILRGQPVLILNQMQAQEQGIGIVYQEKSLVSNLSVADNIFAGNQPSGILGLIDYKKLYRETAALLERLGLSEISPQDQLSNLSPGKQQMVEIAKALSQEPDILILDEPTASISEKDAEILFRIIRTLSDQGKSIIYISHRMSEIFQISDRVTVLKDGQYQGTKVTSETNVNEIIRMMVGRDLKHLDYYDHSTEEVVLKIGGYSGHGFHHVSFDLFKGEILGLAGLVGAGRTELARAIFGIDNIHTGTLKIHGEEVFISHPSDAIVHGLGYLPEHRKEQGLFLEMNVQENIVATDLEGMAENHLIRNGRIGQVSGEFVKRLDIRTPGLKQKVVNLSGGNQQKVVLAKWLLLQPDILIIDEPTHGIDVGAKSEIYKILNELTSTGTSILMISSELPELIGICDRIMVMAHGELTAMLNRVDFSEEEIMHYSSGIKNMFRPIN